MLYYTILYYTIFRARVARTPEASIKKQQTAIETEQLNVENTWPVNKQCVKQASEVPQVRAFHDRA